MKVHLVAALSTLLGIGLAVFSGFSFWPGTAQATTYMIPVTMDEAQAISTCNPNPPPSMGGGSGTVTYDDVTNTLSWNLTFSNLSGNALAAHFHGPATLAETAAIQVTIGDLTSPSTGSDVISEAQETQLLGGDWYVNFHTAACAGGEIRGQVAAGVGGTTQLTDSEHAPLAATSGSESDNGLLAGLASAIAAVALVGAGGAILLGRRIVRSAND